MNFKINLIGHSLVCSLQFFTKFYCYHHLSLGVSLRIALEGQVVCWSICILCVKTLLDFWMKHIRDSTKPFARHMGLNLGWRVKLLFTMFLKWLFHQFKNMETETTWQYGGVQVVSYCMKAHFETQTVLVFNFVGSWRWMLDEKTYFI